jgi:hypothetical protein
VTTVPLVNGASSGEQLDRNSRESDLSGGMWDYSAPFPELDAGVGSSRYFLVEENDLGAFPVPGAVDKAEIALWFFGRIMALELGLLQNSAGWCQRTAAELGRTWQFWMWCLQADGTTRGACRLPFCTYNNSLRPYPLQPKSSISSLM